MHGCTSLLRSAAYGNAVGPLKDAIRPLKKAGEQTSHKRQEGPRSEALEASWRLGLGKLLSVVPRACSGSSWCHRVNRLQANNGGPYKGVCS